MELVIFTEGGNNKGFGHFARCSSLYDAAVPIFNEVTMVVESSDKNVIPLKDKNVVFCEWNIGYYDFSLLRNKYAIVDSYVAKLEIYEEIEKHAKRVLYLDDQERIKYPNGIILNPARTTEYSYNRSLVGSKYALIRSDFSKIKKIHTNEVVNRILIFLGADNFGITSRIVNAIREFDEKLVLDVLLPSNNDNSIDILSDNNCNYYKNLSSRDVATLMLKDDLAIVAGGQTVFELMVTKVPFVCFLMADNQKDNINYLIANQIIERSINVDTKELESEVLLQIAKIMDIQTRKEVVMKMSKCIDGDGANRVIGELLK